MPIPFKIFRIDEKNFDTEVLAPLMRHSQAEGFKMILKLRDEWQNGDNRYNKKGEAFFGAEFEGKVLGVGGRCLDPYLKTPDVVRVRHLYVLPEWRHVGVGSKILDRILDVPDGQFKKVTLRTDNPAARKFYEFHGFKYVGEGEVTHELEL